MGNSTDYFGAVIKGPLEQALVFLDYNNDGNWNPGEPKTRTDADGKFEIKNARSDMSFIVLTDEQTVDNSSGQVLEGVVFKAPLGSEIISPFTTLMVEANLDAASIVNVLDLPYGVDPTKFNPFDDSVDQSIAIAVEISAHQIMSTIRPLKLHLKQLISIQN